jgi:hypothetical protein
MLFKRLLAILASDSPFFMATGLHYISQVPLQAGKVMGQILSVESDLEIRVMSSHDKKLPSRTPCLTSWA